MSPQSLMIEWKSINAKKTIEDYNSTRFQENAIYLGRQQNLRFKHLHEI